MILSGMVYEDAEKLYAEVRKSGKAILDDAFDALLGGNVALTPSSNPKVILRNAKLVGYNTTFFQRCDIVEVPLVGASAELKSQVLQTSSDGKIGYAVMRCEGGGGVGVLCTPATGLHERIMPASGIIRSFCLVELG
jgi:alpha-mannosidase